MRFVQKKPEHRTERLASSETLKALMEIIRTKDKSLITDDIYRETYDSPDGKRSRVEDQLARTYSYKCAYCERLCKADIEHYRPKKAVAEDPSHPGYYWLCYEWSNLLPSCITCNREGSKHNHFPVLGKRVYAPVLSPNRQLSLEAFQAWRSPLKDERPLLLHPEVDHPEDFFTFVVDAQGEGIRLKGIDPEGRGESTIKICRLNRKELTLDRVESVIENFRGAVEGLFIQLREGELTNNTFVIAMLQQIRELKARSLREDRTHTFLRKYIAASTENFAQIVLPLLTPKIRNIVFEAFKSEV
jgi:uncharacterized protein (TIGR02646 family)